jgi:hypothetical protein
MLPALARIDRIGRIGYFTAGSKEAPVSWIV